ncbi:hypothetical protein GIB67_021891 [Kingdonia uniflora]|uniref:Protein kinase domain-containing protein n=1 Tax=Kingdonia uniflora TaxID=39325 RepID=A0A7J7KVF9_9MAGN|nr:hypothetical protein GIB67_021891 [Kingdonia uniflora]
MTKKKEIRESVIVVLDGLKASVDEKGVAPLRWALRDVVNSKVDLLVLTILNPSVPIDQSPNVGMCCFGGEQQPSSSSRCEGGQEENIKFLHQQIIQRKEAYLKILKPFYDRCKISNVKFQVKVAAGFQPKAIVIEEAHNVKATLIIIDRCFAGELSFRGLNENDCKVALVKDDDEAEVYNYSNPEDNSDIPKSMEDDLSPMLFKTLISQEQPHIRDSLPNLEKVHRLPFPSSLLENVISCNTEISTIVETPRNKSKESRNEINGEDVKHLCNNEVPRNKSEKNWDEVNGEETVELCNNEEVTRNENKVSRDKINGEEIVQLYHNEVSLEMAILRVPIKFSWEEIVQLSGGFQPNSCSIQHEEFEISVGFQRDPYLHVIVKRVFGNSSGIVEAEKRVTTSLFHRNIMASLGYYESASATALVYEFAANGTLDNYLYGKIFLAILTRKINNGFRFTCSTGEDARLTFQNRMKIAIGIGKGVRYMHEECPRGSIIHRNLKPCHIFLTHDFQPLVKHKTYVPCDKYSHARPLLLRGAFHELLDEDMEDVDMYEIYRVMAAATQCTKANPRSRPTITQVVSILRGEKSCVNVSSPSMDESVRSGKMIVPIEE